MIDINVTLLIQMVNVLVLLFLMNLVLYRPIRQILAQRKQFIDEQQALVDRADVDALAAEGEFASKIQDARKMGRQKIQDMKAAAYEQEKNLLQSAAEQATKQVQDMRAKVKGDMESARKQLSSQIQSFSVELAQKILGRSL